MNKLTKGAIATAAGIALLMGGAGTFALWNDSATVSGGTIQSGTLTIASTGAGTWKDVSTDIVPTNVVINPASFLVAPGDKLNYTQSFTIGASGNNLKATLAVDPTSIVKGTWATDLTPTVTATIDGTAVSQITSAANGKTVVVSVTLAFDAAADNTTQGTPGAVDLSALKITLTQTR